MYDLEKTGPAPDDMGERMVFERVQVPLWQLIQEAGAVGKSLSGRRFIDCVIVGPCVAGPSSDTRFENCSLGDAQGDIRNLFLRAAGPLMVGVLNIDGCHFQGCIFIGVGFAGDEKFVDGFIEGLSGRKV